MCVGGVWVINFVGYLFGVRCLPIGENANSFTDRFDTGILQSGGNQVALGGFGFGGVWFSSLLNQDWPSGFVYP